MKKFLTFALASLLLCTLFLPFGVQAAREEAPSPDAYIIDRDDLLTDDEAADIARSLSKAEKTANGCRFVLYYYRYQGRYAGTADFISYDIIDRPRNVMVFEIAKESDTYYTYQIHTFGTEYRSVSGSDYNRLENAVHNSVKSGDIVGACAIFAPLAAEIFAGSTNGYAATKTTDWGKVFLISAGVAFVIVLIIGIVIVVRYKRKLKSEIYPLSHFTNMQLTMQSDVFLHKVVTKRQVSSSSSGSGGGRSGGGGHSSGGRH